MTPICSVLIPTLRRVAKLKRAIDSLYATATDFEVILRVNDDDFATIVAFENDTRVRMVIGPKFEGYASMGRFFEETAVKSNAPWLWNFNDDAVVSGKGWDELLLKIPVRGFIVQPEFHQLNASVYPRHEGGAFPFVPNGSWRIVGDEIMPANVDTYLDHQLRVMRGWKTKFLEGITVFHDREES